MKRNNPTAFISYSWDSTEHKQWVKKLTNNLRKNGVDATIDDFITQHETVNLNMMMVTQLKNSDYIIIVLTEEYARKADEVKNGVGFETILSMPYVRENLRKIIPIMRHTGDYTKVFPFHLTGVNAIDFTNDDEFNEKLDELIHRIFGAPLYEVEPLGNVPVLKPKDTIKQEQQSVYNNLIPKLKRATDLEIHQFLQKAYKEIVLAFKSLFEQTKRANVEFDYEHIEITDSKVIFKAYVNGNIRTGIKIWFSTTGWLSEGIFLSYGSDLREASDNSYNEMIRCEVKDDQSLSLKRTMNMFGNNDKSDVKSIVQEIWIYNIKGAIER